MAERRLNAKVEEREEKRVISLQPAYDTRTKKLYERDEWAMY